MAKGGLLGRFLKKSRAKRETAKKKRYLKQYEKAGPKHAMTYAEWSKKGEQPTYFKGAGLRRKTVEARLQEAGISPERFKKNKNK